MVGEFTAAAESGSSGAFATLKGLIAEVKRRGDIDYVVVHKLDRFARDELTDFAAYADLRAAGTALISVTENIDDTAQGMLLHGVLASINAFHSRNLGTEIEKGRVKKAKLGGTPYRAPLGYLNKQRWEGKNDIRTVEVDPDRAPLIRWAFCAYATGNYSLSRLHEELSDKGLTSRPTPRRPARPTTLSALGDMLKNRYYTGTVTYGGVEYQGKHEPLIDKDTFSRVQQVLRAHNTAGEKDREHRHYLKGTVYCHRCGARLLITQAKGNGGTYLYFFCAGRQRRSGCPQPYVQIPTIEDAVPRDAYRDLRLTDEEIVRVRERFEAYVARRDQTNAKEIKRQRRRIAKLTAQRKKLLDAHYAGAIPLDLLREEQERISRDLAAAEQRLAETEFQAAAVRETLEQTFELALDCPTTYTKAPSPVRRQWNQVYFRQLCVRDDEIEDVRLGDGIREFYELNRRVAAEADNPDLPLHGPGSSEEALVEPAGLEPAASALQRRRSSN